MSVWSHIAGILQTGQDCALVTIASAAGSTPREAGARMVVRQDGSFHGTIGGGTLEFQAIKWAMAALDEGQAGLTIRTFSLGPDLGQCCGGRVDVAVEVQSAAQVLSAQHLASLEAAGATFATQAAISDDCPVTRQVLSKVPDEPFRLEASTLLTEIFGQDRRTLYLFGAGHVARALVLALANLPFRIIWTDSRADAFPAAVPSNVTKACKVSPETLLQDAEHDAFVLVMTHSHALDEAIVSAALAKGQFSYVGVIGSATKRARFEKRLRARGISPVAVSGLVCPIGTCMIASKSPAAIAAGVAVELLVADEAARAAVSTGLAQVSVSGR
ncbi:xanthine dehydrogenase accessory protein XdhC [Roseibium polysiphoniae]|uniref:xanthine dehydrogenase accessory protein XdhC n=1 Tax=Roseibium polysiphoniae TaxID=2571221 RepID=UPI003298C3D6